MTRWMLLGLVVGAAIVLLFDLPWPVVVVLIVIAVLISLVSQWTDRENARRPQRNDAG